MFVVDAVQVLPVALLTAVVQIGVRKGRAGGLHFVELWEEAMSQKGVIEAGSKSALSEERLHCILPLLYRAATQHERVVLAAPVGWEGGKVAPNDFRHCVGELVRA